MIDSIYIETTIPSYYVARRSRDVVQVARQELTVEWWNDHRQDFKLFTSQAVLNEVGRGDVLAAELRERLLDGIPLLDINEQVVAVADDIVFAGIVPKRAAGDAFHISRAAVHGMDCLLTWNCAHIANPHIRKRLGNRLAGHGLDMPVICTPEELIGSREN